MDADPALVETLCRLEEELLRPEVRRSRVALEARLAPDFVEIGASGRTWDRPTIVAALADEEPTAIRAEGIDVRLLAAEVGLVTYRAVHEKGDGSPPSVTLRSSIWRREPDGAWRMVFHQGTRAG